MQTGNPKYIILHFLLFSPSFYLLHVRIFYVHLYGQDYRVEPCPFTHLLAPISIVQLQKDSRLL